MNFTNEQLTKAKAAKSAEELLALAKENGIEMTEEEAKKYFAELHKEGELADEELSNVSGGCGNSYDPHTDPNFRSFMLCFFCCYTTEWVGKWEGDEVFECPKCHAKNAFSSYGQYYHVD